MLVGAIIVVLLAIAVMRAPVPYVVLDPGPTVDTLGTVGRFGEDESAPVIEITGAEVSDSAGQLRLTTVGVQSEVNLLGAIQAWFRSDEAVVPRELVYPPGQTEEEVEQHNAEQFTQSQSSAEIAALRHLGDYPMRVTVVDVVEGAPADGVLRAGDVIVAVDGVKVTDSSQLQQAIAGQPAGTRLTIDYLRDGEAGSTELVTAAAQDGTPRIGVQITQEIDAPFELEIRLEDIGGPSAGLMFALGIVDKLEPDDLTGGRVIAGTGSIDEEGNVGAIGGIPQKLVGARRAGASVFLVPAANCAEALANAQPDLTLVRVETLAGAVAELEALRQGRQPTTC